MSVKIRLRRAGSTNRPFYRVVVADGRHPIKGRFIESVGWYDPKKRGANYALKLDRVDFWSDRGAQMSETVKSLVKKCRNAPPPSVEEPVAPAEESADGRKLAEAKSTYESLCGICHASGVGGAPVVGESSVWQPRLEKGIAAVIKNAVGGYVGDQGVMPAKGGFAHLSDEQVAAAVEFDKETKAPSTPQSCEPV